MHQNIKVIHILNEDVLKPHYVKEISKLEAVIFSDSWNEDVINEMLENDFNYIYVALENENILGYYCMQFIADEGELTRIAIAPDFRKQGIGNMLIKHMANECATKGCKKVFLEVNEKNSNAYSLYKKNGFYVISQRKNYYGKGENALIMVNEL